MSRLGINLIWRIYIFFFSTNQRYGHFTGPIFTAESRLSEQPETLILLKKYNNIYANKVIAKT